jgi:Tfp pilus assembly protein PilN
MIQLNLLPDVKLQFIKARRTKRLVTVISVIATAAALVIFLVMFTTVHVVQKKSLSDLNKDITKYSKQLRSIPDLDKILTVQNQLNTLTGLHDDKAAATRLFGYISEVTPSQVTISKLDVDFTANTMSISGHAPALDVINSYTDTLKATQYKTDEAGSVKTNAFSSVVLASFGRDAQSATYTITLNFDHVIFDNANNVTLTVPSGTSSNTAKLFQQAGN